MMLRAGLISIALTIASCAPPSKPPTTSLRLHTAHDVGRFDEAAVTIDDEYVGELKKVRLRGVALPPGPHRVTIELPGYFPFDVEVEASEGQGAQVQGAQDQAAGRPTLDIEVEMVPIPD